MYSIGQISQITGLSKRTLRFYEVKALLVTKKRQDNHYRFYSEEDIDRILKIQFFKTLGFSLDNIREILDLLKGSQMVSELELALKDRLEVCENEINELINQKKNITKFLEILNHYQTISFDELKKINLLTKKERSNIMDTLLSITDNVTGLYNHRYFQETLQEKFKKAYENSRPLSLLLSDLDYFHSANYDFGHSNGDIILKQTGEIMKKIIRNNDILCRYGGDEFTIIFIDTDKKDAMVIAEKIRQAIEEYDFIIDNNVIKMTISIGIANFPDDCNSKTDLMKVADESAYKAKKNGRNKLVYK
jgi:diguanylate cyclase (GGDEF)-like protein